MTSNTLKHNCVTNSIRDGWTYELKTGLQSRIAISHIEKGIDHAQAQGRLSNGSWAYLTSHKSDGLLRLWEKHFLQEPYRYLTLDEFIIEQNKIRKGGR